MTAISGCSGTRSGAQAARACCATALLSSQNQTHKPALFLGTVTFNNTPKVMQQSRGAALGCTAVLHSAGSSSHSPWEASRKDQHPMAKWGLGGAGEPSAGTGEELECCGLPGLGHGCWILLHGTILLTLGHCVSLLRHSKPESQAGSGILACSRERSAGG